MNKYLFKIFLFNIFLCSCKEVVIPKKLKVGRCWQEISKRYPAGTSESKGPVYQLDSFTDGGMKVGTYHNTGYFYLGVKPYTYFDETKFFKFKRTRCPNGNSENSLEDRLKDIEI